MRSPSLNKVTTLTLMILLVVLPIAGKIYTQAISGNDFLLYSYSYKSSANEPYIYPGSRNVALSVDVLNNNNRRLYVYGACITLPQGFSISRGYSSCSEARYPNGSTMHLVDPGGIASFRYYIDLSKDVVPGSYLISITIRYSDGVEIYEQTINGITLIVSNYPPPSLEVINWYWSPDAFPGSDDVYLYVALRNSGNADVVQGYGTAELPDRIFRPSSVAITIGSLNKDMSTSIAIGPVSVYSYADRGPYTVRLKLDITMRTGDGVLYTEKNVVIEFQITVSSPPYAYITVVDYGFADLRVFQGSTRTRFYTTIRNQDFLTIRSVAAYFTITSCGTFVNNSRTSVYLLSTPLGYGDSATLYSDYLYIDPGCAYTGIDLNLNVFGDINGAEFWSFQRYSFSVPLKSFNINIHVADTYWSSGHVYPGTKDAELVIVVENLDVVDVRDATVRLKLDSEIFYPSVLTLSSVRVTSGSRSALTFRPISVSTRAPPGSYIATIDISGIVVTSAGSFLNFSLSLKTCVEIKRAILQEVVDIVDYGWITKKAYISMVNTGVYVDVKIVSSFYSLENIVAVLHLSPGFVSRSGSRNMVTIASGRYSYGQTVSFQFQGIDVVVAESGVYPVALEFNALAVDSTGSEFWINRTVTLLLHVYRPSLNVSIVDWGWISDVATSSTYGASLYLSLQSYSVDTITNIIASLDLDSREAVAVGRDRAIVSYASRVISYGDIVTITFDGIDVICDHCSDLELYVNISAVKTIGSSYYIATYSYRFRLGLVENLNLFRVVSLNTYYNSNPAPLLPSARNVYISIDVANVRPYDIAWIKPEITMIPETMFKVNSVGGSCLNGVARGGLCSLVISIDIDEKLKPGSYNMVLNLTYALYVRETVIVSSERLCVPILVADYSYYRPQIRPSTWYWGTQSPVRALPGQRNTPLTVTVLNSGRYRADDVEVYIEPLASSAKAIINRALCSTTLLPTAYCSATFYIDVADVATGSIPFNIVIRYTFTEYGTHIVDEYTYTIYLGLDSFAGGKGLVLVDYYWANSWPVYPGTENATYVVRFYNSWPYRISGVSGKLMLPEGFTSRGSIYAYSYVSGPVSSLQQIELDFTVSIGKDLKPGKYQAKLTVEYIVESGTPHIKVEDAVDIYLQVNDVADAISLISVQWLGSVPEPRTYGAVLAVSIRNNYVPIVRGATLEVYTPSGILCSDTNTSYTTVPATSISPDVVQSMIYTSAARSSYTSLQEYINQFIKGYSGINQYSYGDILYFYLKLNLLINRPGAYAAEAYLNFIDQWNNVRRIPIELPIHVIGSIKVVDVAVVQPIKIENGEANMTVGLVNIGSAPIYNVYVYLFPQTPLLIPSGGLRYLDVVNPNTTTYVSFHLVYNPVALFSGTAMHTVRYSTAIFMLSILYRDVSGYIRYLNLSIASPIEPFIELKPINLRAVALEHTVSVSGTVINYGLATARNVEVVVLDGDRTLGSSFLGDLDPASQYAFRVEVLTDRITSSLVLKISYRDEYNILRYTMVPVSVSYERRTVSPTPINQSYTQIMFQPLVIALVAAFLAFAGLIMYRYIRKHMHKLSEKIEV